MKKTIIWISSGGLLITGALVAAGYGNSDRSNDSYYYYNDDKSGNQYNCANGQCGQNPNYNRNQRNMPSNSQYDRNTQQDQNPQYEIRVNKGNYAPSSRSDMRNDRDSDKDIQYYDDNRSKDSSSFKQNDSDRDDNTMSDQELTSKAKSVLDSEKSPKYRNLEVRVVNGTAILTGTIDSSKDREYIKNKLRAVTGIKNIDDRVKAQTKENDLSMGDHSSSVPVSDSKITQDIQHALKEGVMSKGYPHVRYSVQNGSVTLTGTISSEEDRKAVLKKVRKVAGVKDVDDEMNVVPEKKSRASSY